MAREFLKVSAATTWGEGLLREFLGALGAAAAWPLVARAAAGRANDRVPGQRVRASAEPAAHFVAAFRKGLAESGYVAGRNVSIEYRWAENQYDRLPALVADLVRHQVAVIVASRGPAAALAAKDATSTIPIVFTAFGWTWRQPQRNSLLRQATPRVHYSNI